MSDDLNFVQRARREKLDALVAAGVTPFAYQYERTHLAVDAVSALPDGADEGPTVRVAGRLVAWRGHGKTAFAHLADFRRDGLPLDLLGFEQAFGERFTIERSEPVKDTDRVLFLMRKK